MIATAIPSPIWRDAGPRIRATTRAELAWTVGAARAPRLRSLRQFAEGELVIPEGKYRGLKLRIHRQPYVGLLFDAMATGRWRRTAILGCVQAGKTFCGFVAPILWHLFEHRETVICGLPTMDVAADKWRDEILPAIRESRYEHLLPVTGPGSRGGTGNLTAVKFRHGPTLKFMTGHGGDEKRSSYTSRVVVITEADKMDEAGESSRETDPVSQLENRTASYDAAERRMYLECTVSIPTGRIWREYTGGTESRIACPCPHCGQYVTPEREHLRGWEEADTSLQAEERAYFVCPACEKPIDEERRKEMNQRAVLLHRGQSIDADGRIAGEAPKTHTLGFRWNAFNNLFWSIGAIGEKHWSAARATDEDAAEKELQQFYWARPWEPPDVDLSNLDAEKIERRIGSLPKGIVPANAVYLTVGLDTGKRELHYVVLAWTAEGRCHVVDFGVWEVAADRRGDRHGLLDALRGFRARVLEGWRGEDGGEKLVPSQVWIDSGYHEHQDAVYEFCRESAPPGRPGRFRPTKGYGEGQRQGQTLHYRPPKKKSADVRHIGPGYHITRIPTDHIQLIHVDADHWKSEAHDRLSRDAGAPGAMTLCELDAHQRKELTKQLLAEIPREVQKTPGRPPVVVWIRQHRQNHYLDAIYAACACGHYVAALRAAEKTAGETTSWFASRTRRK